jgi:hypothetical protein
MNKTDSSTLNGDFLVFLPVSNEVESKQPGQKSQKKIYLQSEQ